MESIKYNLLKYNKIKKLNIKAPVLC